MQPISPRASDIEISFMEYIARVYETREVSRVDSVPERATKEGTAFEIYVRRGTLRPSEELEPLAKPFDLVVMQPAFYERGQIVYRGWTGVYTYEDEGKQRRCVYYALRYVGVKPRKEMEHATEG